MGSDSNSIPEQCQIDMSKWKKLDSRTFGITRSMISSASWVVLKLLQREGFEAYLVGGCVRDLILNKTPKDFDVITTAKLKQIKKRFRRAQIVGRRFPICRVHVKGSVIEVSSFETVAKHGEEKEKVSFSQMPSGCDESDFNRWRNCMHRDFTINSLFFDPFVNKIYDYANGMKDLRSLKLRTLIPAQLSFKEDCARMLRGLRIAARLGLSFSRETETAIRSLASSVKSLDKSRIMLELNYMLSYGSAKPSLCLLWRFNLLDILLPFHGAYLAQQATEPSAQHSMMFMKLFFNLDKLVTCDRPCDCSLWVGLLAFHMALVNKPQDASVVWTLSSVLYHGKWTEGVKFARKHALAPISFSPEILVECDSKSDEELAERVSELASLVQDCAISSTKTGDLSASMSDYPDYPCTGLVFVQKRMAERVAHIFNVLVNGIESYKEGRGSPEIDYYLLGKGDLRETRFVLGKVIMDTMSSGLVQMGTEVLEEKNQLHMSYNEQKPEALEQDCHPILYEVVKHLVVAKEDKKRSLSSFNPELQQERGKKQKLVDIEFDPLEQEIAKEKQKEKNNKHQEIAKKQEMAENEQHQEMAKKHLKMVGKENLQKSAKRQDKVAKNSHLPQQKLARKQNEQHKLEEAVNQKPSRPSLSSLFK